MKYQNIQNTKPLGIFFSIKKYSRWILYFVAQNSLPGLKTQSIYILCKSALLIHCKIDPVGVLVFALN